MKTSIAIKSFSLGAFALAVASMPALAFSQKLGALYAWSGLGKDAQHQGIQTVAVQSLAGIRWKTPVDVNPNYYGSELLTHYGSILITASDTIIVPVKTGLYDNFRVEAHRGVDGTLVWSYNTTYSLPPYDWTPSYGPTLIGTQIVAWGESGGRITEKTSPDFQLGSRTLYAFYGLASYYADQADFDANVKICTPLTSGPDGSVYFGYRVLGNAPLVGGGQLVSGYARVKLDGSGTWVASNIASNDSAMSVPGMNAAPVLSTDGKTVYVVVSQGGYSAADVCGLDSQTLQPRYSVRMKDPESGYDAGFDDDGTAAPLVAPDGDVFCGALEDPFGSNNYRGWLCHYNSTLTVTKIPGAFGWDITPSIAPSAIIPIYHGKSPYLVLCKYNNYAGAGDGVNRVALLDPYQASIEAVSHIPTMSVVASQIGPTPDYGARQDGYKNAVREWCISAAVVDVPSKCAIVNSEDGNCYKWDFVTNTLSEKVSLNNGIGEAYTATAIGPNGYAYAVNNATLYALGQHP